MKYSTVIYAVTLLLLYAGFVNKLFAMPATPDPLIIEFPNILITEVSFKDPDYDWIELYITDDNNNGRGASIYGLQVQDDGIFLSVDTHVMVRTGDYILIKFKAESASIEPFENGIIIYTEKIRLTGTTEQVVIKRADGSIIDAVCWTSSTPTNAEIIDFQELLDHNEWEGTSIHDCIFSENIRPRESIGRISLIDTNSASDWKIFKTPTPGGNNNYNYNYNNNDNDNDGDAEIDIGVGAEIDAETDIETGVEIDLECVESVFINEIMPRPEGDESKNEWIELYNNSGKDCNLRDWIIDDREGGSKPYKIPSDMIIPGEGYVVLPSWQTKIRLNNSEDSARLFAPDGTIIDEIKYTNAPKAFSYARNEEGEFEWTEIPTPLTANIFTSQKNVESENEKDTKSEEKKNENEGDGTLSDKIRITEIFPDPEGPDKGKEWLEIHNESDIGVNMANWTIDTGEGSRNRYTFKNTIMAPREYLTLSDTELSFALRNSKNTVRINNFKGETIDSVTYDNVKEGYSYMKVALIENDEIYYDWIWTERITPGEKNLSFTVATGEIIEYKSKEQLLILEGQTENYRIQIAEGGSTLYETVFAKGNILRVTIFQTDTNLWLMESYELIKQTDKKQRNETDIIYIVLSSIPPLGFLGYMGVKKFNLFCYF